MRLTLCFALLAAAAATTACAPAVAIHPLYTQADLDTSLSLEGTWSTKDGEVWRIQKSEDGYDVVQLSSNDSKELSQFRSHILRLNGQYFADIAAKPDLEIGVAGHLFAKIRLEGDDLIVNLLDENWLKGVVETGRAPSFIRGEAQQIILIAPTTELQKFVTLHASEPEAWETDSDALHRMH